MISDMTTVNELHCVILAAGKGTRMKSDRPKVMASLAGMPLIRHVVGACEKLSPAGIVAVIAPGMDDVAAAVAPHAVAFQTAQLGTGDAARAALPALAGKSGHVIIHAGDVPLIMPETLSALHEAALETGLAVLAMRPQSAYGYGRLVTDENGCVTAIVEERDCTDAQRAIDLVNAGTFCVALDRLEGWLGALQSNNSQKEYYLTDIVSIAAAQGVACEYVEAPEHEVMGINSRSQLAEAEGELQNRLRAQALFDGATLIDPMSVYFSVDTVLGRDVVVEPHVWFGPGVRVEDGAVIHAFSYLEGVSVGAGASVGPFARIRPKSEIGAGASVGNFCEVNRTVLEPGAKAKHVSYLGDAVIGGRANIGAGTVIANYDGYNKHRSAVGEGAFIGSNSTLVSPVAIGAGAVVGAGSVVTGDVPDDALGIGRAKFELREGWARAYRAKNQKSKAEK